jgi:integrase
MARRINILSTTKINALKERGFYGDGGGLYLQVAPGGSKSWVFRFKENGKARDMGLGPLHTINLSEARERATACRQLRLDGIDPIAKRAAERAARLLEAAKGMTFDQCSAAYIADNSIAWRNPKHRQQWKNTLATYVSPVFGSLSVQAIDTGLVLKAVRPIWQDKPETAKRVRGRIETVLSWATANGYRTGDNPARWKGHMDQLLPKRSKVRAVKHHAALPYAEIGAFMSDLRSRDGMTALALEFTILTAARSGEALKSKWSEFDLVEKTWTVPADRMKANREHRVPLSEAALAVLRALSDNRNGDYVFAGDNGTPLSDMSMLMQLRRMGCNVTTHGFRSTFKDWARERTSFTNEVSEAALAHVNGDKVEAAYARGDLFEKRAKLMEAWASFCAAPAVTGEVVSIRKAG